MARRTVLPGRFRRRLTIAFVLVAGVSSAALAVGSYALVRQARLQDSLARTETEVRFQLVVARQFLPLDDERGARLLSSFEQSGRHVLLGDGAQVTPSNPEVDPPLDASLRSTVAAGRIGWSRLPYGGADTLVVGGRIPGSASELYVVVSEAPLRQDLDQLAAALAAGWVAVLLAAAVVGRALARRTLDPVGRAGEAARAVAEGLLTTRLPVRSRDEFGAWAEAFNDMAEALEAEMSALAAARERERRFTADVAHELRTPVTALVAGASLLRDQLDQLPVDARRPAELLVGDVLRLRLLVEELMEISRLDAGGDALRTGEVDVRALVEALVRQRGWTEVVEVTGEPVVVVTDQRRLERVLGNVVGNAVEHGGTGVTVQVASMDDAGHQTGPDLPSCVRVVVTDHGPGIAADHLPRVFDRFYKADPARTGRGSGLGLAIARENVRLLGGDLRATSAVGVGTAFSVEVPATPPLHSGEATDEVRTHSTSA